MASQVADGEFPAGMRIALRRRESTALEAFFDTFFEPVYDYLSRLLGKSHLAEDASQEVFVKVYQKLDSYDPALDPRPWVFAVATNVARLHWRSLGVRVDRRDAAADVDSLSDLLAAPIEPPHRSLARRESAQLLWDAVGELPPDLRMVVLLRAKEGLSHADVARAVGTTQMATRKRYSRALALLRTSLADEGKPETTEGCQ